MKRSDSPPSDGQALKEEKRIFDEIFHGKGGTNPYAVRDELQRAMDKGAYVFRTGEGLAEAVKVVRRLKAEDGVKGGPRPARLSQAGRCQLAQAHPRLPHSRRSAARLLPGQDHEVPACGEALLMRIVKRPSRRSWLGEVT